jgi:hypothetical protein
VPHCLHPFLLPLCLHTVLFQLVPLCPHPVLCPIGDPISAPYSMITGVHLCLHPVKCKTADSISARYSIQHWCPSILFTTGAPLSAPCSIPTAPLCLHPILFPSGAPSYCTAFFAPLVSICLQLILSALVPLFLHPLLFHTGVHLFAPYSMPHWSPPLSAPCYMSY